MRTGTDGHEKKKEMSKWWRPTSARVDFLLMPEGEEADDESSLLM
jgi:hypothetical protein